MNDWLWALLALISVSVSFVAGAAYSANLIGRRLRIVLDAMRPDDRYDLERLLANQRIAIELLDTN